MAVPPPTSPRQGFGQGPLRALDPVSPGSAPPDHLGGVKGRREAQARSAEASREGSAER